MTTNNKLTDEQIVTLQLRIMSALSFYRQRPEKETKNMADLLMLCGSAASELQQRRKADNAEPIYQCEFCHHDANGDLQWHWEDVNKDFHDQYDSERRGQRRMLYTTPQSTPVIPDSWENCNHLLSIGELLRRLEDQTYEKWICAKDAIPDGSMLVPKKETQEMAVAGGDTYVRCEEVNQYPTDAARRIWAAMVAAAQLQEVKKNTVAKEIATGARLTDHRFKI